MNRKLSFACFRKIGAVLSILKKTSGNDLVLNDMILENAGKIMKFRDFICDSKGNLKYSRLGDDFWPMENGKFLSAEHWVSEEDLILLKHKWRDLSSGKIDEFELDYSTAPEKFRRCFKIWMRRIRGDSVSASDIFGVIQDITEFKENELRCGSSLLILETIMDSLPGFVFVKNAEDQFRYLAVNRRFQEAAGIPETEILGRTDAEVFRHDPIGAENFLLGDLAALESGETLDREEIFKIGHASRQIRTIKTVIQPPEGPRLLIGLGMEITRQNRLEEERRRMIRRFECCRAWENAFTQALDLMEQNRNEAETLSGILALIGTSSGAERCSVFLYSGKDGMRALCERIWIRQGSLPNAKPGKTEFDLRSFPEITEELKNGKISLYPKDGKSKKRNPSGGFLHLDQMNIHACIMCGMVMNGKPYGFIVLDYDEESEPEEGVSSIIRNLTRLYQLASERLKIHSV